MYQNLANLAKNVAETFTPVLTSTQFKEKGVLTPEEFVAAGDLLVFKCPTWSWEGGEESRARDFLPKDKQFLVTKNVPCMQRASAMERGADFMEEDGDGDDGEGWVNTHSGAGEGGSGGGAGTSGAEEPVDIPDIDAMNINDKPAEAAADGDDEDDIPDIEDFEEDNLVTDDAGTFVSREEPEDNIVKTRTYDITISYDKFYQTPRVWLIGYDENRQPLKPEQVFEDVIQDYAKKTVTIETHPHLGVACASIHPCKHSAVMKRINNHLEENGKELRVDQYMLLFLKFISSVIPTVEYDYTMGMEG